jgi:hypothetical protein
MIVTERVALFDDLQILAAADAIIKRNQYLTG